MLSKMQNLVNKASGVILPLTEISQGDDFISFRISPTTPVSYILVREQQGGVEFLQEYSLDTYPRFYVYETFLRSTCTLDPIGRLSVKDSKEALFTIDIDFTEDQETHHDVLLYVNSQAVSASILVDHNHLKATFCLSEDFVGSLSLLSIKLSPLQYIGTIEKVTCSVVIQDLT